MSFAAIYRYLRDCYREDQSRSGCLDIHARKIDHRIFVDPPEEILNGALNYAFLDRKQATKAHATAEAYRKEKVVYYGHCLIAGRIRNEKGDLERILAPLITTPVTIKPVERDFFAIPKGEGCMVNQALLDALPWQSDMGPNALAEILTREQLSPTDLAVAHTVLETHLPSIHDHGMLLFPRLWTEKEYRAFIRKWKKDEEAIFHLLPVSLVYLMPRPQGARGVLHELSVMAEQELASPPLQALFNPNVSQYQVDRSQDLNLAHVPAVLSTAQQRVLENAATFPLSMVVGPPGTGKSYTIAAMAVEHLSRGKSVLIASRMEHAVSVVASKIEVMLETNQAIVRGGAAYQHRRRLGQEIDYIIHNMASQQNLQPDGWDEVDAIREQVVDLQNHINQLDQLIADTESQIRNHSTHFLHEKRSWWHRWKRHRIKKKISSAKPLWTLFEDRQTCLKKRINLARQYVVKGRDARVQDLLRTQRRTLINFRDALKARTSKTQAERFARADFKALIAALPIWLVNLDGLDRVLPLETKLFDLAIIDEASQCDLASVLPLLARARRAVFLGDPHQLRHLSFLAVSRQADFARRHELREDVANRLNYRDTSILDLVDMSLPHQGAVNLLNEHFRSEPEIIAFSNQHFYNNALRLMTQKPSIHRKKHLQVQFCKGRRNEQGVNEAEVSALMSGLRQWLSQSPDDLPPASVGLLSPLRAQADALAAALANHFTYQERMRHNMLVGTAHTFQGEERDAMFISLAASPHDSSHTIRFLQQPNLFNVSITRARTYQAIFTSLDRTKLADSSLIAAYLRYVTSATPQESPPQKDSPCIFLSEVLHALRMRGFTVMTEVNLAGMTADMVIIRDEHSLVIDLVGFPGPYGDMLPTARLTLFSRAGLPFFSLPFPHWYVDRDQCIQAIERALLTSH